MEKDEIKDIKVEDSIETLEQVINEENSDNRDLRYSEVVISMKDVTKTYLSSFNKFKRDVFKQEVKSVKALDDISLEVNKGEIFGLLGANGSGKTTIIKLLCGLIGKDSGTITVLGSDVSKTRDYLKEVGAIVEAPSMFKDLTGRENLRLLASLSGGLDEQRIEDILNLVGLKNRADTKFGTYSLGMQQRLGIAQAIMTNPKLLILDEPINGLDPDGIMQMRDLFKQLNRSYGTTILISSHILSEMQELCDRVAFIVNGKIVAVKDLKVIDAAPQKTIAKIECDNPQKGYELISAIAEKEGIEVKLVNNVVYVRCDNETIALINKTLIKGNVNIYSVNVKKRTLEDLYKELA